MPVQPPNSPQPVPIPYGGGPVGVIIKMVGLLLKDQGQAWANEDYICRWLSVRNRTLATEFSDLDLNFDTQVVILPNIAAGTTNLGAFQGEGQQLYSLILPQIIECRLAGQNQMQWIPVPQVDQVIDTDNNSGETGQTVSASESYIASYEWRGGVIYLSPANQTMDVRVRFQSLPLIVNADSPNQPAMGLVNTLGYGTAASICAQRGGKGGISAAQIYENEYAKEKANFEATQVKAQQSITIRLGGRRNGRGNGNVWNGNFSGPIG